MLTSSWQTLKFIFVALITLSIAHLGASPVSAEEANEPSAVSKFTTNYDRGVNASGEAIETTARSPLWEQEAMVRQRPDEEVLGLIATETAQLEIPGAVGAEVMGNLQSMYQRFSSATEFQDLTHRVQNMGIDRSWEDYGHEGDLSDLEVRGEDLADILLTPDP